MKKIVSIIVAAIVMLSMVSCGNRTTKAEASEEVVEVADTTAVTDTTHVE